MRIDAQDCGMTFHRLWGLGAPATLSTASFYALVLIATCIADPLAASAQNGASENGIPPKSIAAILPENGDPDGSRKALAARGITYELNYVGEVQGNVSGGVSRGVTYIGRLEGVVDVDLAKVSGWRGLTLHANGFQIHGDGLSREHIGNLMTVSYIEALATTRLSELWLEQKALGDKVAVRFGQLAADTEFNTSNYAAQFINSTFGWPTIMAVDLPSGGPAYPFATPAVRIKYDPDKSTSLLLGVFNGDPAGPGLGDPQTRNRYGLNFRVQDPAFVIAEGQYRYNQEKTAAGLAGTIKLGAWRHFGRFDDQRFDSSGVSLADPASTGDPARHRGDHGLYAVIDQQVWRPPSGEANKGVGIFARASASPTDRNLIDLYFDGGIVFAGLMPGRPDDVLSFGGAYARISSRARGLDADAAMFGGGNLVRDFEALFEANYQIQVLPGLQVDLDLQQIIHPGGNIAGPGGAAIPDATVLTLHTLIKY
jgi:porin